MDTGIFASISMYVAVYTGFSAAVATFPIRAALLHEGA
jgi:hypothetical protein